MDLNIINQNSAWIEETWKKVDSKLKQVAVRSFDKIPYTSVNGVHDNKLQVDVSWWTNGFWGGLMWLMYEATGNETYRKTAEKAEEMMDEAFLQYDDLSHDVGFMWHIMSGTNYRLTGSKKSYARNMIAASILASRYNIDGKFIRAWNRWDEQDTTAGWTIIDCLMNNPLLYWASEQVRDDRFKKIAMAHTDMSIRDHIRPDGSVNHIVEHDVNTGEVVKTHGGQGYAEGSCWSRGLAWAIYGSIISYIHTGEVRYLDACKKTSNYFITNCAMTNYLPVVDFMAPIEPVYYDSTAGVCAACGMLELAKYVSEPECKMYTDAAMKILKAADEHFCNYNEEEDSLLHMGTERYPHNESEFKGVHIPIIYGDFFFVEALLKLKGRDFFIW